MGKQNLTNKKFTFQDVANKELVIKMLQFESNLMKSEFGQSRYKDAYTEPYVSLTNEYAFNRKVLMEFGYDTSDESVENYRSIFGTYYHSPTDYDKDVIDSSHYMKNNRCVFYTSKPIQVGDTIPNVKLYTLDEKEVTLYDIIKEQDADETIIAAFSMS